MKSTSIHRLNADRTLTPYQLRLWSLYNRINNNILPGLHSRHLGIRSFQADTSGELWSRTSPRSAPAEKLGDLFWLQLPWERIVAELGALHVFHMGCGTGELFSRLQEQSGGNVAAYTGYDTETYPNWATLTEQHPSLSFHADGGDGLAFLPERVNFIVSLSAIERIEEDLSYFRRLRDFIHASGREVLQVHMLPSRIGMDLYGRQGVRQYSPRTVSLITRLFKDFSYAVLYRMGGQACNAVHWKFITRPMLHEEEDLRETRPQEYDRALHQAVVQDNRERSGEPTYYALVIHSNAESRIFD